MICYLIIKLWQIIHLFWIKYLINKILTLTKETKFIICLAQQKIEILIKIVF